MFARAPYCYLKFNKKPQWLPFLHESIVSLLQGHILNELGHIILCVGNLFLFFFLGVRLSPLGRSATNWSIVPAPDDKWVWSSRWNVNWQGKPKYSEKTCPHFVHHKSHTTWTRAAAVGSRRLTAWAMARPGRQAYERKFCLGKTCLNFTYAWIPDAC
jgi:hypothetical protein